MTPPFPIHHHTTSVGRSVGLLARIIQQIHAGHIPPIAAVHVYDSGAMVSLVDGRSGQVPWLETPLADVPGLEGFVEQVVPVWAARDDRRVRQ